MNAPDLFERVAELQRARTPFALATVVERHAPVSSHLGDRAIVLFDGTMHGFVGGACSRDIVRRQAVAAMRARSARMVQIRPGNGSQAPPPERAGAVVVPMTCASEGAVDVYIEPHLPARTLLICGFTPVAGELARLGAVLDGYRVVRVAEQAELEQIAGDDSGVAVGLPGLHDFLGEMSATEHAALVAVVASQGHYDQAALHPLLEGDAPAYVGLLASRKRAAGVFDELVRAGIARGRIATVHNPAGLDIGARRPGEVAISILAEIVATTSAQDLASLDIQAPALASDPVCGMDVEPALASHRTENDGAIYYFCCAHCRAAFEAEPLRYAKAVRA